MAQRIHLKDIESQPSVLRGICERLSDLPRLDGTDGPVLFIAEGTDYHAVAWQLATLRDQFPTRTFILHTPESLVDFLLAPPDQLPNTQIIGVSTSALSDDLSKALVLSMEYVQSNLSVLITNDATLSQQAAWQGFTIVPLGIPSQVGDLPTKSFTAMAYLILTLFVPDEVLVQMDVISIGLASLLQNLSFHPDWKKARDLLAHHPERPLVLVTSDELDALMPAFQSLLTQSLDRPVSICHTRDHDAEAQYVFDNLPPEQWPIFIYFPPESVKIRVPYDQAIHNALSPLSSEKLASVYQIWMSANSAISPLNDEGSPIDNLPAGNIAELSMSSFIPADLIALVALQRLAYDVIHKLENPLPAGEFEAEEEEVLIGESYIRTGVCTQCGECCKNLMLRIEKKTVETADQFYELQAKYAPEYDCFEPMRESEMGVIFKCKNLGKDDLCTDYLNRPKLCHTYPTEDSITGVAKLPSECGYIFQGLDKFGDIMMERAMQGKDLPNFSAGIPTMPKSDSGMGHITLDDVPDALGQGDV